MAKTLPWFRLYAEAVDDEKLRLLAFEDRWHFVALLCCKCQGIFDNGDEPDRIRRKLAVKLGVQLRELDEIHRRLFEEGLVDSQMAPKKWDERQRKSDADSTGAERQRRYREKQQRVSDALRDASVTRPDEEAETDKDKTSPNGEESPAAPNDPPACPAKQIVSIYHDVLPELPRVAKLTKTRQQQLQARWRENRMHQSPDFWREFFEHVRNSEFLMGDNNRSWRADIEWLTKESNFYKTVEGKYHGSEATPA